jgi:hypothetical protein
MPWLLCYLLLQILWRRILRPPTPTAPPTLHRHIQQLAQLAASLPNYPEVSYWSDGHLHLFKYQVTADGEAVYALLEKGELVYLEGDRYNRTYKPGHWERKIAWLAAGLERPKV